MRKHRRAFLLLIAGLCLMAVEYTCSAFVLPGVAFVGMPAGLAAVAAHTALTLAEPKERTALNLLSVPVLALLFLLGPILGHVEAVPLRERSLARAAHEATALVQALRQYRTDHGRPPDTLAALVPAYLADIPQTGLWGAPDFQYFRCAPESGTCSEGWGLALKARHPLSHEKLACVPGAEPPLADAPGAPAGWRWWHEPPHW